MRTGYGGAAALATRIRTENANNCRRSVQTVYRFAEFFVLRAKNSSESVDSRSGRRRGPTVTNIKVVVKSSFGWLRSQNACRDTF